MVKISVNIEEIKDSYIRSYYVIKEQSGEIEKI